MYGFVRNNTRLLYTESSNKKLAIIEENHVLFFFMNWQLKNANLRLSGHIALSFDTDHVHPEEREGKCMCKYW